MFEAKQSTIIKGMRFASQYAFQRPVNPPFLLCMAIFIIRFYKLSFIFEHKMIYTLSDSIISSVNSPKKGVPAY